MRKLIILFGLIALSTACSNPFSGQKSSILKENPTPKNANCSEVHFDQSELNAKQFRAVIHCLNQNLELEEIEKWSLNVSDAELQPWISQFNSILSNEPQFLYSLRESYLDERNRGGFQNLITKIFSKLQTSERRNDFVHSLQRHSLWLRTFISNPRYRLNTGNLMLLSEVKSFNREVNEQLNTGNLDHLIQSIYQYRQQPDALSFQSLFSLFSNIPSGLISKKADAEKISGFINWLITDKKIEVFSIAAESLLTKPISCFGEGKTINDPLNVFLSELKEMSPEQLPAFLQNKIPAVLLLGQGYCKIPPEVIAAAKLLQKSTEQETLVTFFTFMQPLLKDKRFATLLATKSFRNLTSALSKENDTHLFQDIITLIEWFQKNPVSELNTAELLDSIFNEFNSKDLLFAIHLTPEDSRFFETIQKTIQTLPKLSKTKSIPIHQDWLAPLTKDSFAPVLHLLSKMNDENKIIPVIDRMIELFKNMLDRGKLGNQKISAIKPTHARTSLSQSWELAFWKNTSSSTKNPCTNLPLDTNFFRVSKNFPTDVYLKNLNQLSYCFGANQSFASLKDFASYLIIRDPSAQLFNRYSSLQEDLLSFIFTLNSEQTIKDLDHIIRLNEKDLTQFHQVFESGSSLLRSSNDALHSAIETRKLLAKYASKKETYSALVAQAESPNLPNVADPKIKQKLMQITLLALPQLFNEYCPNLDPSSSQCDIEPDQVALYRVSPKVLAEKISSEYLTSSQTWMHPLEFKNWSTRASVPKNISALEFHFNPLLAQLNHNPKSIDSVFNFIKRNQQSNLKMLTYLQSRSNIFYVVPYIFQTARYPENFPEYHQLIRIRILNDIDRLELLAINSDFKPFGLMKNFGMNFIKEIATSWGDVPFSQIPKLGSSETLATARTSIMNQYTKFNLDFLQKVGSCDPRGRNRLGSWIQSKFCRGEISDIRARMFNLGFMLSILDHQEDLELLRDLFYSLYENNTLDQLGVYNNGLKDVRENINVDLLELIPKITRLGLLHQAGLSILNGNSAAISSILSILIKSTEENRTAQISKTFSSKDGQLFVRDALAFVMNLNSIENENISLLLPQLSQVKNQEWLSFTLNLIAANPRLVSTYSPTLHEALTHFKVSPLAPEMISLLSSISADLKNEKLVNESSRILKDLSTSQKNMVDLMNIQFSENISLHWLRLLSNKGNQKQRDQIASFFTGKGFDDFCDVFSDSALAEKSYNFLEKSNQNSGVLDLLEECRRFLH